jgi:hypothetical protein
MDFYLFILEIDRKAQPWTMAFSKAKWPIIPDQPLSISGSSSIKECRRAKVKYQKDTTPIYIFNEPHVVLGSIWQRVGYRRGDGMDSANVDLRKF